MLYRIVINLISPIILYGEIKKARGEYSVEYSLIMIKPGFATNEIITQIKKFS